ncbi:MAG: amidohydrolase family protein [Acidimicrobiales bacterium]|nr:amidohydrolase family protein [Acidimicrobiales bacterium]
MESLGYLACDADNHYYEPVDAFTRHMDPAMAKRAIQWAHIDGRTKLLVGGQVNNFIPNPTFDPIARPGSLADYFKGLERSGKDVTTLFGTLDPIAEHPEYRNRDARLEVMDAQGLESCWMFPTLGVGMEQSLTDDPQAVIATFAAFNRWLDEDWGFAYQDRLFAAPYLTLVDLDAAIAELEWSLDRGARVVLVRVAPVPTAEGTMSPFLEAFDPFWARVAEAGITVAWHGGDTGYAHHTRAWEPGAVGKAFFTSPLHKVITSNRAITETMAAAVCHRVFERHPRLRFATIENGSAWVRTLVRKLDLANIQNPGWFAERPSDIFRRHVWVAPFWEDDPAEAVELMGADRVLFGSDWPHAEGIPEPTAFAEGLAELSDADVRRVMRDNLVELTSPLR